MSDFLTLVESIRTGDADRDPGGGRRIRRAGDRNPQAFSEALNLVERVLSGDRYAALQLTEAMSTSDFPALFGDILDRSLLGAYTEWTPDILQITDQRRVRDFRGAKRFAVDGAEGVLPAVKERAEYTETALDEKFDTIAIAKYGRRISFSWESWINDDLDALRDAPRRFGRGARRSEARFATSLYVGTTGPSSGAGGLYNGSNTLSGNPVLSIENLELALAHLAQQRDEDNEPIMFEGVFLVVPPALETTANRILQTAEYRIGGSSSGPVQIIRGNGLRRNLTLIVDPYIPVIASSSNGNTSWFVFGSPGDSRPALEFDRLIGHEQPEIWMRSPDAIRVGGGTVGPESGSFETDSIDYRVRHVFGGGRRINTGGRKSTVASNGSGS